MHDARIAAGIMRPSGLGRTITSLYRRQRCLRPGPGEYRRPGGLLDNAGIQDLSRDRWQRGAGCGLALYPRPASSRASYSDDIGRHAKAREPGFGSCADRDRDRLDLLDRKAGLKRLTEGGDPCSRSLFTS